MFEKYDLNVVERNLSDWSNEFVYGYVVDAANGVDENICINDMINCVKKQFDSLYRFTIGNNEFKCLSVDFKYFCNGIEYNESNKYDSDFELYNDDASLFYDNVLRWVINISVNNFYFYLNNFDK